MADQNNIETAIENLRKVSEHGDLVTYDLTDRIDLSKPKEFAKALADVFFRKDAINWFKVTDDRIEFNPTYKVRIILAEEHNKLLEKAVQDFLIDLRKQDLGKTFSSDVKEESQESRKLAAAMATSALRSARNSLFKHSMEKMYENFFDDDLVTDILECLEIRSLNNEDLINWKKSFL